MNITNATELTYEEKISAFNEMVEIMPVIERCAEVMGCSFLDLANLLDSPIHKPEFSCFASSTGCQKTIYNERDYEDKIMFQSFEIFNIVILRLNPKTDEAVWLELDNLPCRKEDARVVNLMFTESWINQSEIDLVVLTQLIDFNKVKHDSGIEWRRVLRAFHQNNYTLATQTVDVFTGLPQRLKTLHRQLADFALLAQKIKPTNHLHNPRDFTNQQPRENIYERSRGVTTQAQRGNAATSTTNLHPPTAN